MEGGLRCGDGAGGDHAAALRLRPRRICGISGYFFLRLVVYFASPISISNALFAFYMNMTQDTLINGFVRSHHIRCKRAIPIVCGACARMTTGKLLDCKLKSPVVICL